MGCSTPRLDPRRVYPVCRINGRLRYVWWVVFSMWRWTAIDGTLSLVLTASRSKECLMTFIAVRCPHCQSEQIVKCGKTQTPPDLVVKF